MRKRASRHWRSCRYLYMSSLRRFHVRWRPIWHVTLPKYQARLDHVKLHMNNFASDPPGVSSPTRWPFVILVLIGLVLSTGIVLFIAILGGGAAANVANPTFFSRYFAHLCIGGYLLYVLVIFVLFSSGRHLISAALAWLPVGLAVSTPVWVPALLLIEKAFSG